MTFAKMLSLMQYLKLLGYHGQVGVSSGGELTLEPTHQLDRPVHCTLLKRGFAAHSDGYYVYRPITRKKK